MTCSKCGSDKVVSTYIPGRYRCQDCGAHIQIKPWKEKPEGKQPKQTKMTDQQKFEKKREKEGAKRY